MLVKKTRGKNYTQPPLVKLQQEYIHYQDKIMTIGKFGSVWKYKFQKPDRKCYWILESLVDSSVKEDFYRRRDVCSLYTVNTL